MKKLNFKELEMYLNIDKTKKIVVDVRTQFANMIYIGTNGIECHALAYKIYNSKGEEEYDEKECEIIRKVSERALPNFIDAINDLLQ